MCENISRQNDQSQNWFFPRTIQVFIIKKWFLMKFCLKIDHFLMNNSRFFLQNIIFATDNFNAKCFCSKIQEKILFRRMWLKLWIVIKQLWQILLVLLCVYCTFATLNPHKSWWLGSGMICSHLPAFIWHKRHVFQVLKFLHFLIAVWSQWETNPYKKQVDFTSDLCLLITSDFFLLDYHSQQWTFS